MYNQERLLSVIFTVLQEKGQIQQSIQSGSIWLRQGKALKTMVIGKRYMDIQSFLKRADFYKAPPPEKLSVLWLAS